MLHSWDCVGNFLFQHEIRFYCVTDNKQKNKKKAANKQVNEKNDTQKYKIETLQMQMWRNWRSKILQWNWFALRLLIDFQLNFNLFAYVQAVYSLNFGANIIFGMAFKNISWILPLNRSWHVNCIFLMLQMIFEMEFIAIICNRNKKCLCDKWIIHLLRISSTRFIDCNNRIIVNWIAWNVLSVVFLSYF